MSSLSSEEKRRFLRALKEDEEFRYTVAGYLGIADVIKGQEKLWEEVKSLREETRKLWRGQDKLREGQEKLRASMIYGFGELSRFAGMSFEEFVRKFMSEYLRSGKVIPEGKELRRELVEGEEIDMFFEDPLIVGEVTASLDSEEELDKLLRKAGAVMKVYGRRPRAMYLVALTAKKDVHRSVSKRAKEAGVEIIAGKLVD